MKRILLFLISILIFLFIIISMVITNDNKYMDELYEIVISNTDVKNIDYVNYYDNHYIVMDSKYLYLFNEEFGLVINIDKSLLYDKYVDYDIIYRDMTLMFMDDYKNKEGIIYKYYDIYTGECIDEIIID